MFFNPHRQTITALLLVLLVSVGLLLNCTKNDDLTDEDYYNEAADVQEDIGNKFTDFEESYGREAAFDSTLAWLESQGAVDNASLSSEDSTIWIEYTAGHLGVLITQEREIGDTTGLGAFNAELQKSLSQAKPMAADKKALVLAPYFWDFKPDDESQYVASLLMNYGFDVDYKRNDSKGGENVHLADFENIDDYDVFYLSSHGGAGLPPLNWQSAKVFFLTGDKVTFSETAERADDILAHRIVWASVIEGIVGSEFAILPSFISHYNTDGFDSVLVVASTCLGAYNGTMKDAFLGEQPWSSVYLGWDDKVSPFAAYRAGCTLMRDLLQDSMSVFNAYEDLEEKGYVDDPVGSPAHLNAQGNLLLKLIGGCGGEEGELKWRYETESYVSSSPAIGTDGTIYVGDYYLYALNPDGTLRWRYHTGTTGGSSPTIGTDGTIYVGSRDYYLYALNPDGTLRWKYETGDDVYSSPAIGTDGTVYVGSTDGNLYAINPDGSLRWRYYTGETVSSSPAIGTDGTVYVGVYNYFNSQDCYVYAINPDGTLRWRYETGFRVYSSAAIGAGGTIYVGSSDDYLYALNPDGTLRWKYETGDDVSSSPAIGSDGTVYVGSDDGYLYALNPDGTLRWKYETGDDVSSDPAIGSDGTIYVGSYDDYLYALSPSGTLKWRYQTGGRVFSSPAIGSDGTIYVGSNDDYLYAITSSSQGLANSPWPKFQHDNRNTGRYGGP